MSSTSKRSRCSLMNRVMSVRGGRAPSRKHARSLEDLVAFRNSETSFCSRLISAAASVVSPGFTPASTSGTLYNGTLAAFGTGSTNFATGLGTWAPTGSASESRVYRFTYTVSSTAPNTVQGGTAALGFTWEAQNS